MSANNLAMKKQLFSVPLFLSQHLHPQPNNKALSSSRALEVCQRHVKESLSSLKNDLRPWCSPLK